MKSIVKQNDFELQTDIAEYWGYILVSFDEEVESNEMDYDYDDDYMNI